MSTVQTPTGSPREHSLHWKNVLRDVSKRVFVHSIAIIVFLALWEIVPRLGWVEPTFLPPFSAVAVALWHLIQSGELWLHIEASATRALAGFVLAIVLGLPLGLVVGWYSLLAKILDPLFEIFRNTAPLALLPVFVLIMGLGETSKISLVVYSCVWPILLSTISAVRQVDPLLLRSARSMGLRPFRLFYKVVLPASVPTIFTGVRIAGAYSILVLTATEMVGAKAGLGYLINYSEFNFQIADMYAGILTLSVVGLVFNIGLVHIERRLTAWQR